jgi:anti-sigma regulatory factor (Ser/Thr protein kinase)
MITLGAELHLSSSVADLRLLYPWLDQAAPGLTPNLLNRVHVVLEEAVANAALHGFPDGRPGQITVRIQLWPAEVILEIEDDGIAFDPTTAPPRAKAVSLDDVIPGGWGLGLIRAYCQTIDYRREGDRNRLTLHVARAAE